MNAGTPPHQYRADEKIGKGADNRVTNKNETIPWSQFSQQEIWIKTCNVSFIFVVPDYEAFRVKKNGSHCMHQWCGWLEKNKIVWLSQDDGDAPLSHCWRTGELRMSHAGKCVWVHNSRLGAYLCR